MSKYSELLCESTKDRVVLTNNEAGGSGNRKGLHYVSNKFAFALIGSHTSAKTIRTGDTLVLSEECLVLQ